MPDQVEINSENQKNDLTKQENDVILKKITDFEEKINNFYLKNREPLKNDPVFEHFERIMKEE
jgi:hypothetical protein